MGILKYLKYLHLKSVFTFGNGTYYVPLKISIDVVEENTLFKLILIQLFVFLLFWETRSRYILNYILVMYIFIIPALQTISQYNINRKSKCPVRA